MRNLLMLVALGALLLPAIAGAQVASKILGEGEQLDVIPPGNAISSINGPAVNHAGGYCFGISTGGTEGTISRFVGNADGGPLMLLRSEATIGIFEQTSFESFFGFADAGDVAYSPTCNNSESGSTGLDSVWLSDTWVAMEEEPYPFLEGWFWRFASRAGTTADGTPYFAGGITDVQGGSTQNRGLFYGLDGAPVIVGGDMIPGLPDPLSSSAGVDFDYRYSANGTHYIAPITTDSPTAADKHMIVDSAALLIDGQPVSEGSPVPAAAGGLPGENWANFDYCGITEAGHYFFTGDTSGDTATDEFVCVDGMIVWREGDVVDGFEVTSTIERAYMNENGDVAFVWDILVDGVPHEALFLNGEVLVMETDEVDWTGDGVVDADHVVNDFTGTASLVVADRDEQGIVAVYFTADVEVPGAVLPPDTAEPEGDLDEQGAPEIERPNDRAELEGGFVITSQQVVPVMLANLEVRPLDAGVRVSWWARGVFEGSFEVEASRGSESWLVPVTAQGNGQYIADDLGATGSVTYTVFFRQGDQRTALGSETVELGVPTPGVQWLGAYPNPFNPSTKVAFSVGQPQQVRVAIYSLDGTLVNVLEDRIFTSGRHEAEWDGRSLQGDAVPSGTYLARIESADGVQTGKLMLVK